MTILFIISAIGIIGSVTGVAFCLKYEIYDVLAMLVGLFAMFSFLFGFAMASSLENESPEAIDVYRGKTELKVDYSTIGNDTIVKDSIVIFKPEYSINK